MLLLLLVFVVTNLSCSLALLVPTNSVVGGRRRPRFINSKFHRQHYNPGEVTSLRQNFHHHAGAARAKLTRSSCRQLSHQLFASSSSSSSTVKVSSSSSSSNNNVKKSLLGTTILILLDIQFRSYFVKNSIPFPSSLTGCGSLYIVMILLNFLSSNNNSITNKSNNGACMGERLYQVLNPGANLLATWLPVFFIPSLITLPLSATNLGSTTIEFVKVVSVLIGGLYLHY